MTDGRISVQERIRALEALEAIAWQLNAAGAWLGECGAETEADMLEDAARSVLAACWLLSRPIRPDPPAGRWQQPDAPERYGQPVNGYQHRY
jgi:hypothetical protein